MYARCLLYTNSFQLLNVQLHFREGAISISAGRHVESTVLVSPFNFPMPSLQRVLVSLRIGGHNSGMA
jgi:hypothetical protein